MTSTGSLRMGIYLKRLRKMCEKLVMRVKMLSKYEKILAVAIFGYIIVLSTLTSLRHYCFRSHTFDFGIFVQVFWHSLNGNFMFSQPRGSPLRPTSFLGVHISPLLVLLLPIYALVQSPYTLLVVQAIALGLPALFIYKIGLKFTGKEKFALLFAVGYLVYPGTLWSNWYDFHLEAFVPLFGSMVYYYYFCGDKSRLILSMILLLTTFERSLFIVLFFVIYIFVRALLLRMKTERGSEFIGRGMAAALLAVAAFSLVYFVLSEHIMSIVWPERSVFEPAEVFGKISYNDFLLKISYITILSAPLLFLSFNSPLELLPAAPYLFLAMASDYDPYFTVTWQYPALISVPFFVSAILGYIREDLKRAGLKLIIAMMLFSFLINPLSPLMAQFSMNWAMPVPTSETHVKHQALSILGRNVTVLAQENIFPHVAERKVAYTLWPSHLDPPDYIVVDVLDILFYHEPSEESTSEALFKFKDNCSYGIVAVANGLVVLQKDYRGPREILTPLHFSLELDKIRKQFVSYEDYCRETHFFIPDWVKVEGDHLFLNESFAGTAWWGPWVTVPPGKYRIEVHFSVDRYIEEPVLTVGAYHWISVEEKYPYFSKTVSGHEIVPGEVNIVILEFEWHDWLPLLEVFGESYGKANIRVYKVEFEMIE
jgi:uncharacterized membrane protein